MSCEKHKINVEKYSGNLEELANDIGDLRYDSLKEFFSLLSKKIKSDAKKDKDGGRVQLSNWLTNLSESLKQAEKDTGVAWHISKKHMKL
jgi:hypothetical protein